MKNTSELIDDLIELYLTDNQTPLSLSQSIYFLWDDPYGLYSRRSAGTDYPLLEHSRYLLWNLFLVTKRISIALGVVWKVDGCFDSMLYYIREA